VGSKPV